MVGKLGAEALARQEYYAGGKIVQQVGEEKTPEQIRREQTYAQEKAEAKAVGKTYSGTVTPGGNIQLYGGKYISVGSQYSGRYLTVDEAGNIVKHTAQTIQAKEIASPEEKRLQRLEQERRIEQQKATTKPSGIQPGSYISPQGYWMSMISKEAGLEQVRKEGGTYYGDEYKYSAQAQPSYITEGVFGSYIDLSKPGGFAAAAKEYGTPSISRIPEQKQTWIGKTTEWGKEKYEAGKGFVSEGFKGLGILAVSEQFQPEEYKQFKTKQKEELMSGWLSGKEVTGEQIYKYGWEKQVEEFP